MRFIVRGKEVKKVEFGFKVYFFNVDGISFVEYFSFDNFNEVLCLLIMVECYESYFEKCW